MITLIIYFAINLILAVILTIYKSREVLVRKWWKLAIYAVVMLVFGLPIVIFGFLFVWIVGLIAKKTRLMSEILIGREPKKLTIPCPNCKGLKTYENTKNFGWTIITNSLFCGDCGRAFYFGNSTEKQITIK